MPPVPGPEVIECDATPLSKDKPKTRNPGGLSQLTSLSGKQIAIVAGSFVAMAFMLRIFPKMVVVIILGLVVYFWLVREDD